jgi:hypothetical protein
VVVVRDILKPFSPVSPQRARTIPLWKNNNKI